MSANPDRERHRAWVLTALEEFEGPLRRYACKLTGDADAAQDVVQHAFMRLCGERAADIHNVRQWLYAVCRHRAIDLLRKGNRMQALDGTSADRQPDDQLNPAEAAELHDTAGCVRQILKSLPEPQREVVDLWAEGLSYREIAGVTDRTESNVRLVIHRAFKAVRAHPLAQQLLAANGQAQTSTEFGIQSAE